MHASDSIWGNFQTTAERPSSNVEFGILGDVERIEAIEIGFRLTIV